jgi:uncharacterized iron-regulated protein
VKPSVFLISLLLCPLALAKEAHIVDTASGKQISREQLLKVLQGSDYILLGELHDNASHHNLRGTLLKDLHALSNISVVAEHMERNHQFEPNGDLIADLQQAGFDAKGWGWPLHSGLFTPIVESAIPLFGGNITREVARSAVREGVTSLPAELNQLIATAPLDLAAQETLDADLLQSHCGHLPSTMLEGLRLAQRARDAAMFEAMQFSKQTQRNVPVALVAGNGHVRLDYGVPSLIRKIEPDARFVSVGFTESTAESTQDLTSLQLRYDYVWSVEATENREDPCLTFKKMKPVVSEATK